MLRAALGTYQRIDPFTGNNDVEHLSIDEVTGRDEDRDSDQETGVGTRSARNVNRLVA